MGIPVQICGDTTLASTSQSRQASPYRTVTVGEAALRQQCSRRRQASRERPDSGRRLAHLCAPPGVQRGKAPREPYCLSTQPKVTASEELRSLGIAHMLSRQSDLTALAFEVSGGHVDSICQCPRPHFPQDRVSRHSTISRETANCISPYLRPMCRIPLAWGVAPKPPAEDRSTIMLFNKYAGWHARSKLLTRSVTFCLTDIVSPMTTAHHADILVRNHKLSDQTCESSSSKRSSKRP